MGTTLRYLAVLIVVVAVAAAAFALLYGPPRGTPPAGKLRIVSPAPNVTEILFALGLGATSSAQLKVATTRRSASIPRVSGFGMPRRETLLAIAPDLVIACGLEEPETLTVLQQSGVRVVDVQPKGFMANFPELFDAIRAIGRATDRAAEAQALVARMEFELQAIAARVAAIEEAQRPRVFVEVDKSPLMTAGGGSFIDDLIARAGGRNVAHEIQGAYPRINPEQVIAWDPQVILVAHGDVRGTHVRLGRRPSGSRGKSAGPTSPPCGSGESSTTLIPTCCFVPARGWLRASSNWRRGCIELMSYLRHKPASVVFGLLGTLLGAAAVVSIATGPSHLAWRDCGVTQES